MIKAFFISWMILVAARAGAQAPREHLLMDFGWRFAFGNPNDQEKDFGNGTGYFSYFAKAGFGDGAAAPNFDDRTWRVLDLPHDWAVEQDFSPKASFSHGYKAIGRHFPDRTVGWYRKKFIIPASDEGRRIHLAFDGVFRHSIVWINGHYLGTENSGYQSFEYDITDYLNYGGENTVAVRVDAGMEEGWFYEGAGIYRHVWLNKTGGLHVATDGSFVVSKVGDGQADITAAVTLQNDDLATKTVDIEQAIVNAEGQVIARDTMKGVSVPPFGRQEYAGAMVVRNPRLWSVDTPYLHRLITTVRAGRELDHYETVFGIRSIRFDPNEGFFLNGHRLEIKGTNNHQDHAGVGTAMPDGLQVYRVASLKALGANAYRCSHNPPTPELLDACDRLGMLVIDENRLMGTAATQLDDFKHQMLRDRNHPSVIAWSIGNEEWGIENNVTGARIATTLQAYVKSIDSTRAVTAAFSGGWGQGLSAVMDLIGYNYIAQERPDEQHKKFPWQSGWGTEEGSTFATRGIYVDDSARHWLAAYDRKPRPSAYSIEEGWKYYAARPFLAGMFIWTGFDYRGEPTPFGWPSVGSYFGMLDQCGFLKDDAWYLKAWWTKDTILHLLPHWNWGAAGDRSREGSAGGNRAGRDGPIIPVWAYSNCDAVELFLNGRSLGKKSMPVNGHVEWAVAYHPGTLAAVGYKNGRRIAHDTVKTTGEAAAVHLAVDERAGADKELRADKEDIKLVTIYTRDRNGLHVPTATNEIRLKISGPGKIIGVGNGDPTSLEADRYDTGWRRKLFSGLAQVIIQSTDEPGKIRLEADAEGLAPAVLIIQSHPAQVRPHVPAPQSDSGLVVYTLGSDTTTLQYFQYKNRRFKTTILDLDGTIEKYEAVGLLDETGDITEVHSRRYHPDSAGNWSLMAETDNVVTGDSTVAVVTREGKAIWRRVIAGKAIVSNAADPCSFYMFPYMGFFAAPSVRDTLFHCHFALGSCRSFNVTRVSPGELHVGSSVMGRIRLFTGENGRMDSANAIGSSLNFIAGVARDGNDYPGYIDELAKVKWTSHSAVKPTMKDSARLVINHKNVSVDYWSPMTRGRQIFGAVVPWNRIWRTGANNATKLRSELPLLHDGQTLPAGEYSLWTYPTEKGWWLIVNKKANVWGTEHDSSADMMKWPMHVEKTTEKVEALKIDLLQRPGGTIRLQVAWDLYKAWVDFTTFD